MAHRVGACVEAAVVEAVAFEGARGCVFGDLALSVEPRGFEEGVRAREGFLREMVCIYFFFTVIDGIAVGLELRAEGVGLPR